MESRQSKLLTTGAMLVCGTLLVAGCSGPVDKSGAWFDAQFSNEVATARKLAPSGMTSMEVEKQPAAGSSFAANLSRDYKALMLFEADEMYDDVSAEMYAKRAIATSKGEVVQPVELKDFNLPAAHIGALKESRANMETLFSKGAPDRFPGLSAKLQSSFDCWVEQQEENHQPDHIAACRKHFATAYQELASAMEPKMKPTQASAPAPAPKFKDSYTVYFALDSDKLDPTATKTLEEVIQALKTQNAGASIVGYTDTLGKQTYNASLSQRRAKAIAEKLLGTGIRPAVLTTQGKGEADLAVPTSDNVGEPRNRRAVINIR